MTFDGQSIKVRTIISFPRYFVIVFLDFVWGSGGSMSYVVGFT